LFLNRHGGGGWRSGIGVRCPAQAISATAAVSLCIGPENDEATTICYLQRVDPPFENVASDKNHKKQIGIRYRFSHLRAWSPRCWQHLHVSHAVICLLLCSRGLRQAQSAPPIASGALVLSGKRDKPPHRDSYCSAVRCFGGTGDFIA